VHTHARSDLVLKSWTTLVDVDRDWAPSSVGTSLYIGHISPASRSSACGRPSSTSIRDRLAGRSLLSEGLAPRDQVIENTCARCRRARGPKRRELRGQPLRGRGGKHEGFTQVLWLDGVEHRYIRGGRHLQHHAEDRRRGDHAPLGGTILAGVTRDTALAAAQELGRAACRRRITIDECGRRDQGTLQEVWATGTAAVISRSVSWLQGRRIVVNQGKIARRAKLYDTIGPSSTARLPIPGWTLASRGRHADCVFCKIRDGQIPSIKIRGRADVRHHGINPLTPVTPL